MGLDLDIKLIKSDIELTAPRSELERPGGYDLSDVLKKSDVELLLYFRKRYQLLEWLRSRWDIPDLSEICIGNAHFVYHQMKRDIPRLRRTVKDPANEFECIHNNFIQELIEDLHVVMGALRKLPRHTLIIVSWVS